MPISRAELVQAYRTVNGGRDPTPEEMSRLEQGHAGQDWIGGVRGRAEGLIGTPYAWGGTTKQGIDCSAFISNVWGVPRQTTDTLSKVAKPVTKEALRPGDALNLTTGQDPRGYGHVRMFDGWADPQQTTMTVYESSSSTGGVVRRVIPYDPKYTPMRLASSPGADERAEPIAQATAAAGATTPSRPPDPHEAGLGRIYRDALAAGLDAEGARAAVAVAQTEGGMTGDVGDLAHNPLGSAGSFQLNFGGGQGNAYARSRGISDQVAQAELVRDPHSANAWALKGYLGQAIKAGQAQGLTGPALAEYAQRVGQVSVNPERAGQNYPSAERQRFLEQNTPGTSTALYDAQGVGSSGQGPPSTSSPFVPNSGAANPYSGTPYASIWESGNPSTTQTATAAGDTTAATKAANDTVAAQLKELLRQRAYTQGIIGQVGDVPGLQVPQFALPSLQLPGFRPSKFQLPFGLG